LYFALTSTPKRNEEMDKTLNTDSNIIRNLLLKDFKRELLKIDVIKKVAIVGGGLNDPEALVVQNLFPNAILKTYGLEEAENILDLNIDSNLSLPENDLVICTNVIEHIHNHENFAKNLLSLLKKEGNLWCAFPMSDMYHGSPHYFSAGFDPQYLVELFKRHNGETIKSKIISSKRSYLFTHLLRDWPSEFRYNHPFFGQIAWGLGLRGNPRPPIRNVSFPKLIACVYLCFIQKNFNEDPVFGVSSWVLVQKRQNTFFGCI
jgi:hypothetical protein